MTTPASPDQLALINQAILSLPFHRFLGLEITSQAPGHATIRIPVNDNTANSNGVLHGGVLYAVVDVAAFMALAPLFSAGETAVSHDVHVSIMRPVVQGDTLELKSEVRRRGKGIAFMTVEAYSTKTGNLTATGSVTKTFVPMRT